MYRAIDYRISTRKYKDQKISDEHFKTIQDIIRNITPLNNDIPMDTIIFKDGEKIINTFKGFTSKYAKVTAPHYIAFTSKIQDNYLENIGYIGEQTVLKLTELGIGTCWVGSPIDEKTFRQITDVKKDQKYIILIAFGYPEKKLEKKENRKRKQNKSILSGNIKNEFIPIIDALRKAPSAINSQPWKVHCSESTLDVYIEWKNILTKKFLEKNNHIDIGIGLSHMVIAAKQLGYDVEFINKDIQSSKNKKYIITIKIKNVD